MKKTTFTDRTKKFFEKYFNGWKGTISIFLVIIMSPMLSIAMALSEGARYQSAVEMMKETIDASAFSTIGNYDSYLDERFGLMGISQENDINSNFSFYMEQNVNALGKTATINSDTVSGKYPLSDTEVLKQQILENSEVSVTTQLLSDGFDLDDVVEKLQKMVGLEDFEKQLTEVTDTTEIATSLEEAVEAVIDMKDIASEYSTAYTEYYDAESQFKTKAIELADEISDAESELDEDDEHDTIYEEDAVKDAIKAADEAATTYKEKCDKLNEMLGKMSDGISELIGKFQNISDNVNTLKCDMEEDDEIAKATTSTLEWINIVVGQALTSLNDIVADNYADKADQQCTKLTTQSVEINSFNAKNDVTASWSPDNVPEKYDAITIDAIRSDAGERMENLENDLNQKAAVDDESKNKVGNLLDIAGEIMGLSGVYDSSLNSVVADSSLYNVDVPLNVSSRKIVASINNLVSAGSDFVDGIKNINIIKAAKGLVKFLKAVVEFIEAIVTWVYDCGVNLGSFLTSGASEMYNSILLYGYGVYNMPNRVSIDDGETLYGYDLSEIYSLAGGSHTKTLAGTMEALVDSTAEGEGTDTLFKGAEGEYLIAGTNSEIQNQVITFFDLYMFRLLVDFIPVITNEQLGTIASAAGPLSWLVKVCAVMIEPMVDCILLVNGSENVYLIKDDIWLSYTGMVSLAPELLECTNFSDTLTDKLKNTFQDHYGESKMDGKLKTDYNENLLFIMIMMVNQSNYLQRMQNLIQMEGLKKYEDNFKLDKTYTFVKADVDYTLNPMYKLDSLTEGGLFKKKVTRYIGY